jgi:hypothetical protein
MKKTCLIFLNALPVLVMIGFIPVVVNDYALTLIDILIIIAAFMVQRKRNDLLILGFGFIIMIISEAIFVSTKVETFDRKSLLGLMPLWLPFLWAYGFVAIKRSIEILG